MCGISGIFYLDKKKIDKNKLIKEIISMNKTLEHRGPDDSGYWIDPVKGIALGQTRLSILDLSQSGHQPMVDKNNIITYNGEVFNYRDINTTLLKDESFTSSSDTETLLKLYMKEGKKFLKRLNGMFAFGLWDDNKNELLLARDISGKKPLYYTQQNGKFVFASELKAILNLSWIKKELDEKALYDFLTYNTTLTPSTMFNGIYKFQPGYLMRISKKGILEYIPYYELQKKKLGSNDENEISELIYNSFYKSVKDRMISDVPVGAFLSGGVDSSAIVSSMRQNTNKQIKTFTIGFQNQPNYNELKYAEKVSKMYNTDHHIKIVRPHDLLDFLPTITDIYDEPQADTTAIPIYFISKLAKEQNIKVVLNGDGADELFAGYNNYLKYLKYYSYFNTLKKLPGTLKSTVNYLVKPFSNGNPFFEMMSRLSNNQELFWPGAGSIKESQKKMILSNSFNKRMKHYNSYFYVEQLLKDFRIFSDNNNQGYCDPIEWMSFSGYKHADRERFLFRADRLGMANSVETRSPFLNIEMVELALSVPSQLKVKNNIPKYILKKSFEKILPTEVLYRKKMGFCLPINEWASKTIVNYVELNIDSFSKNFDFFDKKSIKKQTSLLKRGNTNYTNNIWTIYFLINWFDKWF